MRSKGFVVKSHCWCVDGDNCLCVDYCGRRSSKTLSAQRIVRRQSYEIRGPIITNTTLMILRYFGEGLYFEQLRCCPIV